MAKSKTPCRYTMPDGLMCGEESLMPEHETKLCVRHTADGMSMFTLARQHAEPISEREQQRVDREQHRGEWEYRLNSVVYYIQFRDRIKIGTTMDLRRRLTAIPFDRILVTERGDETLERRRHTQFKHCRVNGEWFKGDDPVLLAHIAKLNKLTSAQRNATWNGERDTRRTAV